MPLLSDLMQSFRDVPEELHTFGIFIPEPSIPEIKENMEIEDYRRFSPPVTMLCMLLPSISEFQVDYEIIQPSKLKIKLLFYGIKEEQARELLSHPRWSASSLDLDYTDSLLKAEFQLNVELERASINYHEILKDFGFNGSEEEQFLQDTRRELEKKILLLQEQYQNRNWSELRRIAHSIKGSAMNLQMNFLRNSALIVENAAKKGNCSEDLLRELLKEADKVIKDLPNGR